MAHGSRSVPVQVEDGLATFRLSREHGNAINGDLVDGLTAACARAAEDDGIRAVTLAADGKLFCPGLDVQELIELDRPSMEDFIARFEGAILALYTFPKPLVAAIHGHAVAGGCVLALTADWRVLRAGAVVGLNEVKVGVPLPFGVAMILRESVGRLAEVALFGKNYGGEEAIAVGLVDEHAPADRFESVCRERVRELAAKDGRAFAMTKRYLRSPVVERIRAHDAELACEFVDRWFSPETRVRLERIAAELKSR